MIRVRFINRTHFKINGMMRHMSLMSLVSVDQNKLDNRECVNKYQRVYCEKPTKNYLKENVIVEIRSD